MIVMKSGRQWINFARYSSPATCIGKARQMEVKWVSGKNGRRGEWLDNRLAIYMRILMDDGHEYEGWLKQVMEEEE